MRRTEEFWRFVCDRLYQDEAVMLMIVCQSKGSSPGRPGFKMAVAKDGFIGSVGGGVMEVSLVEKALAFLETDEPVESPLIRSVHRKDDENSSGMICSGEQTLLIRKIEPVEVQKFESCISALRASRTPRLRISNKELVFDLEAPVSAPQLNVLAEDAYEYTESIGRVNKLYIVGGGHCSLALSEMMSRLGFQISVFDDRPSLNSIEKNKYANTIEIVEDYGSIARFIESGEDKYVVVMTIGYKYDKVVIRELLDRDFKYFGVLGSRAKMARLMRELADEGQSPARLNRIRTPIGIEIKSQSPEEIAVSIAAEIILTKNKDRK